MVDDAFKQGVERKMRIALYGLPCAGKTTLLNSLRGFSTVINGGDELKKLSGPINERRKNFLEILKSKNYDYFIDGHYQFVRNGTTEIAFTNENEIFDVFMYLYQKPSVILNRMQKSDKNKKYLPATEESIAKWQNEEIESLRTICHNCNKDFYIIDDCDSDYEYFVLFCKDVLNGFSNVEYARKIVSELDSSESEITLLDGDKTITKVDTSKVILGFKTDIFDNNFYTGYQFWIQDKIIPKNFNMKGAKLKIETLEINEIVLSKAKNPVIISSGLKEIWSDIIGKKLGIKTFSGKEISAETKFFVTKFLKQRHFVTAYGDSKNDLFMLKEANEGFLVVTDHLSRSLQKSEIKGIKSLYINRNFHVLSDDKLIGESEMNEIQDLISITKSDSGINGNRLASAHFELGKKLCRYIFSLPEKDTTIISLERSGRFIADGMYMEFDCRFETYNSKCQSLPKIYTKNVVLIDGVINNGKSMLEAINCIESVYPNVKIIVVAGVINELALPLFESYDLFVVRVSKNKFTGSNVRIQKGNIGPDTADRLFNQLN